MPGWSLAVCTFGPKSGPQCVVRVRNMFTACETPHPHASKLQRAPILLPQIAVYYYRDIRLYACFQSHALQALVPVMTKLPLAVFHRRFPLSVFSRAGIKIVAIVASVVPQLVSRMSPS